MTGYDKIAILLAELGNGAREAVLEKLNFSSEQLKKIGELRGIYKDVPHGFIKTAASEEEKFRQSVMANPEAIAQALEKWLKSDD